MSACPLISALASLSRIIAGRHCSRFVGRAQPAFQGGSDQSPANILPLATTRIGHELVDIAVPRSERPRHKFDGVVVRDIQDGSWVRNRSILRRLAAHALCELSWPCSVKQRMM